MDFYSPDGFITAVIRLQYVSHDTPKYDQESLKKLIRIVGETLGFLVEEE